MGGVTQPGGFKAGEGDWVRENLVTTGKKKQPGGGRAGSLTDLHALQHNVRVGGAGRILIPVSRTRPPPGSELRCRQRTEMEPAALVEDEPASGGGQPLRRLGAQAMSRTR